MMTLVGHSQNALVSTDDTLISVPWTHVPTLAIAKIDTTVNDTLYLNIDSVGAFQNNIMIVLLRSRDNLNWSEIDTIYFKTLNFNPVGNTFKINVRSDTLYYYGVIAPNPTGVYFRCNIQAKIVNNAIAGIGAVSSVTSINVFPNPSSDIVNVSFNSIRENQTIVIYNLQGQVVKSSEVKSVLGDNQVQLNVSDLNMGFYLIKAGGSTFKLCKN